MQPHSVSSPHDTAPSVANATTSGYSYVTPQCAARFAHSSPEGAYATPAPCSMPGGFHHPELASAARAAAAQSSVQTPPAPPHFEPAVPQAGLTPAPAATKSPAARNLRVTPSHLPKWDGS